MKTEDFNSLGPSDTIWRQRSGSTSAQVLACCLMAPSHYLNQSWLIISEVQWHSYQGNFTRDAPTINHWNLFENYISKFYSHFPRGQWVRWLFLVFKNSQLMLVHIIHQCGGCLHTLRTGEDTFISVTELGHLWFNLGLVAFSVPSHYLSQSWLILYCTPSNTFQSNLYENKTGSGSGAGCIVAKSSWIKCHRGL